MVARTSARMKPATTDRAERETVQTKPSQKSCMYLKVFKKLFQEINRNTPFTPLPRKDSLPGRGRYSMV
jgi:hypothetical protein